MGAGRGRGDCAVGTGHCGTGGKGSLPLPRLLLRKRNFPRGLGAIFLFLSVGEEREDRESEAAEPAEGPVPFHLERGASCYYCANAGRADVWLVQGSLETALCGRSLVSERDTVLCFRNREESADLCIIVFVAVRYLHTKQCRLLG